MNDNSRPVLEQDHIYVDFVRDGMLCDYTSLSASGSDLLGCVLGWLWLEGLCRRPQYLFPSRRP